MNSLAYPSAQLNKVFLGVFWMRCDRSRQLYRGEWQSFRKVHEGQTRRVQRYTETMHMKSGCWKSRSVVSVLFRPLGCIHRLSDCATTCGAGVLLLSGTVCSCDRRTECGIQWPASRSELCVLRIIFALSRDSDSVHLQSGWLDSMC